MNSVSVFHWETCLQYFDSELSAREALEVFQKQLVIDRQELEAAFKAGDNHKLTYVSSRLTGAAAYCGAMKLHLHMRDALPLIKNGALTQNELHKIIDDVDTCLMTINKFLSEP